METSKIIQTSSSAHPSSSGRLHEIQWLEPHMERRLFRHHLRDKLPFVIGVSGHREPDPKSLRDIEPELRKQLLAWRKRLPETPFIFLSSLARGADRAAARIASEPEIGAELVVPLPLPIELYRTDFPEQEASDLEQQLAAPETISFQVPLIGDGDPALKGPARDAQYALAGAFIARHCHVLIALWDGHPMRGTGGTAEVVRFKLEGIPKQYLSALGAEERSAGGVDPLELGPVYHFPLARSGEPATDSGEIGKTKVRILFPRSYDYESAAEAERYFEERIFLPVEAFNREKISTLPAREKLLTPVVFDEAVSEPIRESLSYLDELRDHADRLAIYFAGHTRRTLLAMSVLVFFAALCFDISADLADFPLLHIFVPVSMLGFPLFIVVALWLNRRAIRRRFQDRHQDYRALSEGLRVQFFWQLAGLPDSVAAHYLGQQRSELYWIRRACAAARMFLPGRLQPLTKAHADIIKRFWMEPQRKYFFERSEREHARLERFELAIQAFFTFSLLAILVVGLMEFEPVRAALPNSCASFSEELIHHSSLLHMGIELAAVMAGVIAALCHNYVQKLGLSYHVKQYHRMERIFRLSTARFEKLVDAGNFVEAQKEIRALGEAALSENGDWVLAHRDRPLEVPHH